MASIYRIVAPSRAARAPAGRRPSGGGEGAL